MKNNVVVRRASADDWAHLVSMVKALADYEKLPPPDSQEQSRLREAIFGDRPRLDAYIAEIDNAPVGYALVLETYSSFRAKPLLYLEDLFVLPEHRKRGAGEALFQAMADEARSRGCFSMDWHVLDWNTPSIEFYKRKGARHRSDWQLFRLEVSADEA